MAFEWKYRGRIFNLADIESIRRLIAANPEASRWALSRKLCEAWDCKQANGALRDMVCRGLLLMLERAGSDPPVPPTPAKSEFWMKPEQGRAVRDFVNNGGARSNCHRCAAIRRGNKRGPNR